MLLKSDLTIRQQHLQEEMQKQNIDACILTTSVNLFYMAGVIYNGYYYLPSVGDPIHFIKRSPEIFLDHVVAIRKPEQISEELLKIGINLPQNLLLEEDALSFSDCSRIILAFGLSAENVYNGSSLMRTIRSVKSEYEIEQIKKCAAKHIEVYKEIPSLYKEGMTDLEFQYSIEFLMRQKGSLGIFHSFGANMDIYMGSLLVGNNAEYPSPFDFALGGKGSAGILPLGASGEKIKKGNTIMVDMAGNYTPWMTDMTRIYSLGKVSDLAYKAHQVSIEIHDLIEDISKEGVLCADLYNAANKLVIKYQLGDYFMGTKQQAKFIGHGVGLEINEPPVLTPRSKEVLKEGTVFALEPKFVIPNVGAVGIENTYLVHRNDLENLTVFDENIIVL